MQFKFWRTVKGPNGPMKIPFWKRHYTVDGGEVMPGGKRLTVKVPVGADVRFEDGVCIGYITTKRSFTFKELLHRIKDDIVDYLGG